MRQKLQYTIESNTTLANFIPFYSVRGFSTNDSTATYGNNSSYTIPTGGKGSASNGTSGDGWTDCKVNPTTISITYDCEVPDATAAEVATAFNTVPKDPTPKTGGFTESQDGNVKKSEVNKGGDETVDDGDFDF